MLSHSQIVILILVWVFGSATILIMGLRLLMRLLRKQQLYLSDYLTILAILCVMTRSSFATVVDVWGNNSNLKPGHHPTTTEIYQREIGSKLTLADRMVYNTYLWIQKSIVLLLYNLIFSRLPLAARIIKIYWVVLLVTYCAVQATSFVDCRPVQLYWQVVPGPGPCTNAAIQLSTFVALNMATDVMLLIFPLPAIFKLKHCPLKRRLQLIGIFSLGILLTVIAILRLPIYRLSTSQVHRYTWGSVEQFSAALVANLPTLYSLRKRKSPEPVVSPDRSSNHLQTKRSTGRGWTSEQELADWPHFVESGRGSSPSQKSDMGLYSKIHYLGEEQC